MVPAKLLQTRGWKKLLVLTSVTHTASVRLLSICTSYVRKISDLRQRLCAWVYYCLLGGNPSLWEILPRGAALQPFSQSRVYALVRASKSVSDADVLHNASAHSLHPVENFLAEHGITQVHQPPYSPDTCDFSATTIPELKGKSFKDVEKMKQNTTKQLQVIRKAKFQNCLGKREQRSKKVV